MKYLPYSWGLRHEDPGPELVRTGVQIACGLDIEPSLLFLYSQTWAGTGGSSS